MLDDLRLLAGLVGPLLAHWAAAWLERRRRTYSDH